MSLIRAAAAMAAVCLTTAAHAAVITEPVDFNFNPDQLAEIPILNLPAFDPSLGALQSASLLITGFITPGNYIVSMATSFLLKPSMTLDFYPANGTSAAVAPFMVPLTNEQSITTTNQTKTGAPELINSTISLPTGFVTERRPGDTVGVQIAAGTDIPFPSPVEVDDVDDATSVYGRLTLTYTYTAVPEPSALAVLLLPIGALVVLRRRSTRAAHQLDRCARAVQQAVGPQPVTAAKGVRC